MPSSSELQREQEVNQYLQSWRVAQGSAAAVALNVESLTGPKQYEVPDSKAASPDKTLSAFAQLAVLRLKVRRAMVSLIDSSTQTILAEATRDSHCTNDLWLGVSSMARSDAVCEHCLIDTCTAREPSSDSYTTDGLIVPDCRYDPRFREHAFVQSEPGVQFYAGVPIISPSGYKIGAYAVSDEKPREGLTIDELQFMQGVAQAVMEHLEWARDRVDRFGAERIVSGLAAFTESSPGLEEDDLSTKQENSNSGLNATLNDDPKTKARSENLEDNKSGTSARHTCSQNNTTTPRLPPNLKRETPEKPQSLSRLYHRAARTLRDSTFADGVVLLSAIGANVRTTIINDGSSKKPSHNPSSSLETPQLETPNKVISPFDKPCKLLAHALPESQNSVDIEQGSVVSVGTLERYSALFPQGKIFSFTETGTGPPLEKSKDQTSTQLDKGPGLDSQAGSKMQGKVKKYPELLECFPGARWIAFIPLFDYTEGRLAGGCFLWSLAPSHLMKIDKHLPYLRIFGSSIMNEVGRIRAQKNEAAKTTFIASMSHELRSPLHGVLGAAEFLKDTNLSSHQSSLVNSISACGKTLLDTLEHVLDFSKINKLGPKNDDSGARESGVSSLTANPLESLNAIAVVDLAVLVEEVVDAVAAGSIIKKGPTLKSFQGTRFNSQGRAKRPSSDDADESDEEGMVSVLLDICPNTSWLVKTQPGALRRIVMNLFGNSLKYTTSGVIQITLRGTWNADRSSVQVEIRVSDTGKGMSDEFQQSQLFLPFSQEDSFQPGTGLGLSIVKQIIDSLGGSIRVESKRGKGTTIDVRCSLTTVPGQGYEDSNDEEMKSIAQTTKGRKLILLEGTDSSDPKINAQSRQLEGTLGETRSAWFGIRFFREDEDDAANPDFFLYCEPPSMEALKIRLRENDEKICKNKYVPIIIVCLNAEDAVRVSQEQTEVLAQLSEIVELIPQPCGPQKLARVFRRCLSRIRKIKEAAAGKSTSNLTPDENRSSEPGSNMGMVRMDSVSDQLRTVIHSCREPEHTAQPTSLAHRQNNPLGENIAPVQKGSQPQQEKISIAQPTSLHVCLVDDNEINLQLLVMFMKKSHFSYEEARNGQEAVDRFKEASIARSQATRGFDVVLMDISMPVMNGIEATKQIRAYEHENRLRPAMIIALTGLASADAQRDAEDAGVDYFMPKPVRFVELKKLLITSRR